MYGHVDKYNDLGRYMPIPTYMYFVVSVCGACSSAPIPWSNPGPFRLSLENNIPMHDAYTSGRLHTRTPTTGQHSAGPTVIDHPSTCVCQAVRYALPPPLHLLPSLLSSSQHNSDQSCVSRLPPSSPYPIGNQKERKRKKQTAPPERRPVISLGAEA